MNGQSNASLPTASFGNEVKQRLTLAKCRAILGADAPESDTELGQLREALYGVANVVVESIGEKGNALKRSAVSPDNSQATQSNFGETLSEDERYALEERAAINEFDGGLDRKTAEEQAFNEYRAKNHRFTP